jgi:cytochrome b subunit of formate dehydrogenase
MRTIKTYFKGAPFYNAFLRSWPCLRIVRIRHCVLPSQEVFAVIAYDKGEMKSFFVCALAFLSGLFVFGVGIYRGWYYADASPSSMATILIHAVTTSILIALGGATLSWTLKWIRKQKKPDQNREISN